MRYTDPTGHYISGDYYDPAGVETLEEAGAMMRVLDVNPMEGGKRSLPIVPREEWGQYAPGSNPSNMSDADRETYDPDDDFGGYYEYKGDLADELHSAVIHHVGDGGVADNPLDIEQYHMADLGYYDVAYHYIVGSDGAIYEG